MIAIKYIIYIIYYVFCSLHTIPIRLVRLSGWGRLRSTHPNHPIGGVGLMDGGKGALHTTPTLPHHRDGWGR